MKWIFGLRKDDERYFKTVPIKKIEIGNRKQFKIKEKNVIVFIDQNKYYVFENKCPHRNLPIDKGYFKNSEVICNHHN